MGELRGRQLSPGLYLFPHPFVASQLRGGAGRGESRVLVSRTIREGGATPHTEGMPRDRGVMAAGGRAARERAPPPTSPLSQEHRSGGCSWAFRSWYILLGRWETVEVPPGRQGVCLTHAIHTHIYAFQAWLWNGERNSDTILTGQA